MMTDILTAIEVDTAIEDATDGLCGVADITGIDVREVPARFARDGVAYWSVLAKAGSEFYELKAFTRRASAEAYAEEAAFALDLELAAS